MKKLNLKALEVKSFVTGSESIVGGISGTRTEGPTTPHECGTGVIGCPKDTYSFNINCNSHLPAC